jgi:hypothetical protein
MSKLIVKQVFDLYEQNYEHKHETAAFCFWLFIIHEKHDESYLHSFLNLVMTSATDNPKYFSKADYDAIISAQAKDAKELRRIWREILFDTSNFDYDSFQAIIKVDELLESIGIESVWHFDGPVELFGKYKHLLDMKEVNSYPQSRNGPQS